MCCSWIRSPYFIFDCLLPYLLEVPYALYYHGDVCCTLYYVRTWELGVPFFPISLTEQRGQPSQEKLRPPVSGRHVFFRSGDYGLNGRCSSNGQSDADVKIMVRTRPVNHRTYPPTIRPYKPPRTGFTYWGPTFFFFQYVLLVSLPLKKAYIMSTRTSSICLEREGGRGRMKTNKKESVVCRNMPTFISPMQEFAVQASHEKEKKKKKGFLRGKKKKGDFSDRPHTRTKRSLFSFRLPRVY